MRKPTRRASGFEESEEEARVGRSFQFLLMFNAHSIIIPPNALPAVDARPMLPFPLQLLCFLGLVRVECGLLLQHPPIHLVENLLDLIVWVL